MPCVTADDPLGILLLRPQSAQGRLRLDLPFLLGPRRGARSPSSACGTRQKTNKVVGTLFNTALDDNSWHDAFIPAIKKAGYTVVDPGQFPAFGNDFTAQIGAFKSGRCRDRHRQSLSRRTSRTFWTQSAQQGYKPKIVTLGKAFLFPVGNRVARRRCRAGVDQRSLVLALSPLQVEPDRRELQAARPTSTRPPRAVRGRSRSSSSTRSSRSSSTSSSAPATSRIPTRSSKPSRRPTSTRSSATSQWTGKPVKNVCTTPVVAGQWQKNNGKWATRRWSATPAILTFQSPLTLLPLA